MTFRISALMVLAGFTLGVVAPACGGSQKGQPTAEKVERVEGIDDTIAAFKAKDASITPLFTQSAGYVVLPDVGEGALIIGGGHGSGEAYEAGGYIGRVSLSEVTVGAQIGGQSYSQVVFFQTPVDFKKLKDNAFEFSAELSAVAAEEGVAKNAKFKDGVATFILPKKGLMAAASVGGQKLDFTPAK